ncbi:MAG: putative lipid II flippase FtsW [Candidatus Uhrbacteria bacterium]|nr:putative lipid II flippase FtsW [Patescibacteria group bacterium]MBU1906826.1 putative lipid II flippase FtsW [Patescibacteria group bacterium]
MRGKQLAQPDYVFMTIAGAIIIFGLVMLASAAGPMGYERFADSFYYVKHQLIFGLVPGAIALYVFYRIPYAKWRDYAFWLLIITIVLLVLVFVPGIGAEFGTSHSWINLFGLTSVQPSEFVKLTFLFYLAAWLEIRGKRGVSDFVSGLLPFLFVLGSIMLLMILQPDVGTMSIIVVMSLVVYFVAGAPMWHIGLLTGGCLGLFLLLIKLAPYRAARFTTFLHPELDPQGIGYHINQALLAIGSGGIMGLGYGHSRQKFQYLPEVFGDSIFAVIAEELGFVLCLVLVGLFVALAWRGLRIAQGAPDNFARYVVIGIIAWIIIQAFVNIGSMVGLLPMTGVPLPFVSYGGTSLVVLMAAMGVILNISRSAKI